MLTGPPIDGSLKLLHLNVCLLFLPSGKCGHIITGHRHSRQRRVVGGYDNEPKNWPWLVQVMIPYVWLMERNRFMFLSPLSQRIFPKEPP